MSKKFVIGSFPSSRLRRNRKSKWLRALVSETNISASDLILPVFIEDGKNKKSKIDSMPGVYRLTVDLLVKKAKEAKELGIPAIAIFPKIKDKLKTEDAAEAYNPNGLVQNAVKEVKKKVKDIGIICDVALDPYTSHGQDGIVKNGYVENDETIEVLCKQAVSQARAGCDIVAPSDMMDGRVGAIREALDREGFKKVGILAYSAKYASSFYGPFRDAVGSAKNFAGGDKKTYQMDIANSDEAIREIALDIKEGADIVMVKPGMAYLDIIRRAKDNFKVPIFAYQVSGEYSMMKAADKEGWLKFEDVMYESLISFKRAGADAILTYAAIDMAEYIKKRDK